MGGTVGIRARTPPDLPQYFPYISSVYRSFVKCYFKCYQHITRPHKTADPSNTGSFEGFLRHLLGCGAPSRRFAVSPKATQIIDGTCHAWGTRPYALTSLRGRERTSGL